MQTKRPIHVADLRSERSLQSRVLATLVALVDEGGARTFLVVPMLKGAVAHRRHLDLSPGGTAVHRQADRCWYETFAAQAVIAIENARLLNELRQRTDELGRSVGELRALGEVSQAVNSTLDLETVLSTIVAKAVQLSGTEAGAIYVFDDAAPANFVCARPTAWIDTDRRRTQESPHRH